MGRFDNYKTNCYWYGENQDMSATLVFCERQRYMPGWQSPIDSCPENCSHYITTKEVDKMVLHKAGKRKLRGERLEKVQPFSFFNLKFSKIFYIIIIESKKGRKKL